jgi:hypothetical protein
LLVGIVAGGALAPDPEAGPVDTAGLEAPVNPTAPTTATTLPPVLAGWQPLSLEPVGPLISIAHGPGGWLAAGPSVARVMVSADGLGWVASSLPSSTFLELPRTLVTSDEMIVASSSSWGEAGADSWISTDRGATWQTLPISEQAVVVTSLTVVNNEVFATGSIVDQPEELYNEVGRAAAWWLVPGSGWVPLTFEPQPPGDSRVAAIVDANGFTMAVGYDGDGIAAWRLSGTELVRVEVTAPGLPTALHSVAADPAGGWAALVELSGVGTLMHSRDLQRWVMVEPGIATGSTLTRVGETLFVTGWETAPELLVGTRRIPLDLFRGSMIAVAGTESVAAAVGVDQDGQPGMWTWGGAGSLDVATPPTGESIWQARVAIGRPVATDVAVLEIEAGLVAVTDGRASLVSPDGAGWLIDSLGPADGVVGDGKQAWLIDGASLRRVSGRLAGPPIGGLPLDFRPVAATEIDGALHVAGFGGSGYVHLVRAGEGWEVVDDGLAEIADVRANPGMLVVRELAPERVTWITDDGATWARVDGRIPLAAARWSIPYLVAPDQPVSASTTVLLADRWPELQPVTVPAREGFSVGRYGDQLRVLAGNLVMASADGGESWDVVPAGLQHSVSRLVALAPTEDLSVVALTVDGELAVMTPGR